MKFLKKYTYAFLYISSLSCIANEPSLVTIAPDKPSATTKKIFSFNPKTKEKDVKKLIDKGLNFITEKKLSDVIKAFTHSKDFIDGELYLFVIDMQGVILAHGQQQNLVFQNMYNYKDKLGFFAIKKMIEVAKNGGGWISYEWRDAIKKSYIQKFTLEEKEYVIGCGYYPHLKSDNVIGLVKGAVSTFDDIISKDYSPSLAFAAFSYPLSEQFIRGDLYLYALGFDGTIWAQADRPGLVGLNSLDYQDSNGLFVNKEIIKKLDQSNLGVWITYLSKNAKKVSYAEKVTDKNGKDYFIACGYYPDTDKDAVIELIRKGYQFMKTSGKMAAVEEFSNLKNNNFRYGDLFLTVYDTKGNCITHGENKELIGRNFFDAKDENGKFYVRELIRTSQDKDAWVDIKINNSFLSAYSQKIDLGLDQFIIVSGIYPTTKANVVELLVKSAISKIESVPEKEAFHLFSQINESFIRGDLYIIVLDENGLCYAYGDQQEFIWKNLLQEKDDHGKPYIQLLINTAKQGPGTVSYTLNNHTKVSYVEQMKKNGKTYTVASGFYL